MKSLDVRISVINYADFMVTGWQKLVPQAKFDVKFVHLGAIKAQALTHSGGG
jgi:hypothetical protein